MVETNLLENLASLLAVTISDSLIVKGKEAVAKVFGSPDSDGAELAPCFELAPELIRQLFNPHILVLVNTETRELNLFDIENSQLASFRMTSPI